MSKTNYPKRNLMSIDALYGRPDDEVSEEPATDKKSFDEIPKKAESLENKTDTAQKVKKKTENPEKTEKPVRRQTEKAAKKEYVMTYFSEDNYNCFEEMFDFIKRKVRQKTGTKLKATNVAEISIMIAYDLFKENKNDFIEKVLEKTQAE